MKNFFKVLCVVSMATLLNTSANTLYAAPSEKQVLDAMKKASTFMVNEVSYNGGYGNAYTSDLSVVWGEAPFRPTMISVQGATPDMGTLFLETYKVTGDEFYLKCAEKAANALIWGQHPLGGWNYYIDFNIIGLEDWYRDVFSQFKWGMEEWRHYYGNCTYDDGSTIKPTRLLLNLYMTTLDPAYRAPLIKALNFILISQYPNGGWPQRYPLRYDFVHDGLADYTSYYTFNDGGITNQIDMLIEAYEQLGNEEYLTAALRGADFIIISQTPEPYAGWAQQYDMDLKPAWARTHEPSGLMARVAKRLIPYLEKSYLMTGDRRYLSPIPRSLSWLKTTIEEVRYVYFDPDTNEKTFQVQSDRVNEKGYGIWDYPRERPESAVRVPVERQKEDLNRLKKK